MSVPHPLKHGLGDFVILLALLAATVLLAGTLIFTVLLQFDNHHLITETTRLSKANHELAIEDHSLALRSDRNHAEEEQIAAEEKRIYGEVRYLCQTYLPHCTMPHT